MITIKVTIERGDEFKRLKNALTGFGKRSMLQAVGKRFVEIAKANFGEMGIDRPLQWPPYARNYPNGKRKGSPATLIETLRLRSSVRVLNISQDYVECGADTPYAAIHQFGMPGKMPVRPYLPTVSGGSDTDLTPYAQNELEKAAVNVLEREMNKP